MATIACPHCAKPVVIPEVNLPTNLNDVCREFPLLCKNVNTVQAQLAGIAQSVANLPSKDEHIAPSESVIQAWLSCPDCKPKFQALLKESPQLFKPGKKAEEGSELPFYAKPGFGRE